MTPTKLVRPLLALVLIALSSLACEFGGGPPAIGEVVVAESLDADYKPINPTTSYTSDDTVINISVEIQNFEVESIVEVKFKLNGEDYETLTSSAGKTGSGYYGFTITVESGLMPGDYVADVSLDGQPAKTVTFKVTPSGPPSISTAVTAKDLDDSYKPVDPTSIYGAGDTLYISVKTKDLIVGSNVTVKYYYEGEHAESADATIIADKAGSGYFGFSLTPPPDGLPIGNYEAQVYLDGVLSTTVEFSVQ